MKNYQLLMILDGQMYRNLFIDLVMYSISLINQTDILLSKINKMFIY